MKYKRAILMSILIHIGLVILLVANVQFSRVEITPAGELQPTINAKAVNSQRVEQLVEKLKQDKLREQQKEKERLESIKKQEDESERKLKEQEQKTQEAIRKLKMAEEQSKAEEQKAADLKKKRIDEEVKRKKKADEEQKRAADLEQKRLAEAARKQKEVEENKRKAKEEADKKRKAAEEKAQREAMEREMAAQMDAEAAELAAIRQQQANNEAQKFVTLIIGRIKRNWIVSSKGYCIFKVKLSPGGLVLSVVTVEGDAQHCASGERAIYKSEPLPVSNDPDVFNVLKDIRLTLDNRNE